MKWLGLGLGLSLGGGLVYVLITSTTALIVTAIFGAFVLGGLFMAGPVLLVNRQWTNALGAGKSVTNNKWSLPEFPTPPVSYWQQPGGGQLPQPDYQFPMIEAGGVPFDDGPVA